MGVAAYLRDKWVQFRGGPDGGPAAEEVKLLSDQFRITLRASLERVRDRCAGQPLFERLDAVIADQENWNWNRAYEVEQLLVQLYDSETLRTELACRVRDAETVLRPSNGAWYRAELPTQDTDAKRRALLARLLNDLQWRYTVNEARRGYTKEITGTTGFTFAIVVGVFLILALIASFGGSATMLILAAGAGAWGAVFSMLTGLRGRLDASSFDDLKLSRANWMLAARVLIGLGAALAFLFFLIGGLVEGSIFPDMTPATFGPKDEALLIVWSFLAGFSERLVPSLLSRTEGRLNADPVPDAGSAARPTVPIVAAVIDEADEDEAAAERPGDDARSAEEREARDS